LQEYALTKMAISNNKKKKYLFQLHEAIKKYKNVILIPGSLASYERLSECSNIEKKKKKVMDNYMKSYPSFISDRNGNPEIIIDKHHTKAYKNALRLFLPENIGEGICLQNSAYILASSHEKKLKHRKSSPFNEGDRLAMKERMNHFYYV